MKSLTFIIPIAPSSMQKGARWGRGRFYNDPKKALYYSKIYDEIKHLIPIEPIAGPLEVEYAFFLEWPKTIVVTLNPNEEVPYWSHGDKNNWDNLVKGTQDALEKAGVFCNDGQIWRCRKSESRYCSMNGFPRIEVTIYYEEGYKKEAARNKAPKKVVASPKDIEKKALKRRCR